MTALEHVVPARRRARWIFTPGAPGALRVGDFDCGDCGADTLRRREYYMVHTPLWRQAQRAGRRCRMLCVGCLEARIGRRLTARDFMRAPVNADSCNKSMRLRDRLSSLDLEVRL